MDNREAKFILNAYRPGGQDANDPRFAEGLEQVRRDPILERWFVDSIAFEGAIASSPAGTAAASTSEIPPPAQPLAKLPSASTRAPRMVTPFHHAIVMPPDLRENIIAGVKVSRPLRAPFIKWAIAAALILMAILGSLIWHETRPAHLAGWQSQALDVLSSLVRNESSFDAQSHNANELLAWLRANHASAAQKLPDNLGKLESIGCKTFSWNGIPVSVICFMRPDGGLIHLVTANASGARDRALKGKAEFLQQGHWVTATWREGEVVYMLAL